ncbi:hypothetical protein Pcinc_042545 [Petrolisthes cinctipes]|uniref:Uncharacterized protein n=1 Tax=Petrolisthes cinctipes TaxID=88211 RepID=A0AAE1BJJ5_PETCI|nr:hypothetical protein Pcinc_042545 [Petrolisthes cinctipes]
MDGEEMLTLLDTQRKYFNDALDRIQRQSTESMKDADKKINEYTQSRLDESLSDLTSVVKEKNEALNEIRHLSEENKNLTQDPADWNYGAAPLPRRSRRRNNLPFSAIPEQQGEYWEQCQVQIMSVLKD